MRAIILAAALLLPACSEKHDSAQDARDIAQVEAMQKANPPPKPIDPQPMAYMEISQHKLYGAGCNFVPDGGGLGAIVLAQRDRAYIKLDGKIVTLASDAGSTKMPQGSWSRYSGREHALTLTRAGEGEGDVFVGHIAITDPYDQVVYQSRGNVQCKGG
jgi:hypothetical protein